jgi:predicted phosphoribosyltransferase
LQILAATAKAAIKAARKITDPKSTRIVVAAPVMSHSMAEDLANVADSVEACFITETFFGAG